MSWGFSRSLSFINVCSLEDDKPTVILRPVLALIFVLLSYSAYEEKKDQGPNPETANNGDVV